MTKFNFIITLDVKFRFWRHITTPMSEDGCWIWKGKGKYGSFKILKVNYLASRFSYYMHNGVFDERLDVLHHCDNGLCVNPKHLFLGTDQDNVDDKVSKNRQARGAELKRNILTEDQVYSVREKIDEGYSCTELSEMYNVHVATIHRIKTGNTWKHLLQES